MTCLELARTGLCEYVNRFSGFTFVAVTHARLTVYEYRKRIDEWYARLDESLETNTMKPRAIGATVDKTTGKILNITNQGESATAGLRIGWHLRKVNGHN